MQNESEKLNLTYLPAPVPKDNFQQLSQYVKEPIPEFDDAADIRDYLEIILRRKWLILIILLISDSYYLYRKPDDEASIQGQWQN